MFILRIAIAVLYTFVLGCYNIAKSEAFGHHQATSLYLGASFDPVDLSRAYGNCIVFDSEVSLDKPRKANGIKLTGDETSGLYANETQFNVDIIRSKRDFYRYLHISASVSGHYKLFSGGAAYEQEEEDTYNSDGFSWIVRATTDYGRFGMLNSRLSSEASALRSNLPALKDRCGTEYISQVNRSVLAAIVYRIKNVSESSKRRIEASFNASIGGGLWGVNAAANYKSLVQEAISEGTLELKVYLVGGDGLTTMSDVAVDASDVDKVKKILIEYTKKMGPERAVPTTYISASLSTFVPELSNIDYSFYFKTLDSIFFLRSELIGRANRVRKYLLEFTDFNGSLSAEEIRVHPNWVRWSKNLNQIEASVSEIVDTAATCRSAYHFMASLAVDCTGVGRRRISDTLERVSRSGPSQFPSASATTRRAAMLITGENAYGSSGQDKRIEASKMLSKATNSQSKCESAKDLSEIISNACALDESWLRPAIADLPPALPFEVNFRTNDRQDAAGNVIRSLIAAVRGPTVQRIYLEDATGKTLEIGEAQGGAPNRAATATSDIAGFVAAQFPLVIKGETINGRIYRVTVPLKN